MAGLALKALAMADRAIQKTYNSIIGSTWGKAAVNDIKNVTSYIDDGANGAYNDAKNIASKSNLVGLATDGAQGIAEDVSKRANEFKAYRTAKQKTGDFFDTLGGSEEIFKSNENVYRTRMVLQQQAMRDNKWLSPKDALAAANVTIDEAARAGEKTIDMTFRNRLDWRYRRLNGKLNTHRIVTDAIAGTAAVGAVGAAGYGAVSYFGDE